MTQPRVKSDLYQVDFVAALFGAFLLIWISGSSRGNSPEPATGSIFVVELWIDRGLTTLIPPDAAQQCADQSLISELDTRLPIKGCDSEPMDWSTLADLPMSADDLNRTADRLGTGEIFAQPVLAEVKFYLGREEIPVSLSGFALRTHSHKLLDTGTYLQEVVAIGSVGERQPDAVSVNMLPQSVALVCKLVGCKDASPALFGGPSELKKTPFGIVVRSLDWERECLENDKGVFNQRINLGPCSP